MSGNSSDSLPSTSTRRTAWLEPSSADRVMPKMPCTTPMIEHGIQQTQRYAGVRSERWTLENDDGSWTGTGESYASGIGGRGFVVLVGSGAYEGLTAFVAMEHDIPDEEDGLLLFEGVVVPEPPPSPPNL